MRSNSFCCLRLLLAVVLLSLTGCGEKAVDSAQPEASEGSEQSSKGTGVIRKVDLENAEIEHEAIANVLPAGTDVFALRRATDAVGLLPGDPVEFTLVLSGTHRWIKDLHRREVAGSAPSTARTVSSSAVSLLREGDSLPDFMVVNERGERLTRENFAGKTLLITFVVIHCPSPDHCPVLSHNFLELAQKIDTDQELSANLRLLTICLDPVRESGNVLINYRGSFDAPRALWQITTASPNEIERFNGWFGLNLQRQGETLAHGLCTVIVDPAGRIKKLLPGNSWRLDDILAEVR